MTNRKQLSFYLFAFIMLLLTGSWASSAKALTFDLPANGDDIVGQVQWTQALPSDTFNTIGRRFDVGYFELVEANPTLDPDHLKAGTLVVVPTEYILPPGPRVGIVINLAELRLFYYPPNSNKVITFPIGIGREGSGTLMGPAKILRKQVNPTWVPTPSTLADDAKNGIAVPRFVPPGPDNPLGAYAFRFHPTYLIHGTNDPASIGRRSSAGCVHLLPEDVESIYDQVKVGTPVNVISMPYKAGWLNGKLYLEAHVPLQEDQKAAYLDSTNLNSVINKALLTHPDVQVDWDDANKIATEQNGIPQAISNATAMLAVTDVNSLNDSN